MFSCHTSPQKQAKLVKLVGNRCLVKCFLDDKQVEGLWDTGAQVSIISHDYLSKLFPGSSIRDISELLDTKLNLATANGSPLPYNGWVELRFKLSRDSNHLVVPFLVSSASVDAPLIGYNVIEAIFKENPSQSMEEAQLSFPNVSDIETLVNCIHSENNEELSFVKSGKTDFVVPKGGTVRIP